MTTFTTNSEYSKNCKKGELVGKKEDLTGRRFGRLTVIEETDERRNGAVMWLCKCDCGNYTTARANHLKRGGVMSCGCYNKEKDRTHGLSKTRLHSVWADPIITQ